MSSRLRAYCEQILKAFLAVFCVIFVYPMLAWSQDGNPFAPGVKVLASLESRAFAWSPNGRSLTYMTSDGIWTVEAPDFRRSRRLVRKGHCAAGSCPAPQLLWSPDGKHLAFMDSRPGDGWSTIWVMNADGSEVRDLLPVEAPFGSPGSRAVSISTWLNNREIAFGVHCGTGCVSLNKVAIDNLSYEHFCIGNMDGGFSWSPRRNRVVGELHLGGLSLTETAMVTPTSEESLSDWDSCAEGLSGCQFQQEEWQGKSLHVNAWSPDGKRVLYTEWQCLTSPLIESSPALSVWDVEHGRQERLLENSGWGAWSANGLHIAFLLFGEPRYDANRRISGTDLVLEKPFRVYVGVMDVTSRAVRFLLPLGSQPVPAFDPNRRKSYEPFRPVWSPDGQQFAVLDPEDSLSIVRVDGAEQKPIMQGRPRTVSWSPDGKYLTVWLGVGMHSEQPALTDLERFLPPVGKEDATRSDAEIIQRYFVEMLKKIPDRSPNFVLGEYRLFLQTYAQQLERASNKEAGQAYLCQGLKAVFESPSWRGKPLDPEFQQLYAACQSGEEAQESETTSKPSETLPPPTDDQRQFWAVRKNLAEKSHLQSFTAPASETVKEQASLFIIEALQAATAD